MRFTNTGETHTAYAVSEEIRAGHTVIDTFAPKDPERAAHLSLAVHEASIYEVRTFTGSSGVTSTTIVVKDDTGVYSTISLFGVTKDQLIAAAEEA